MVICFIVWFQRMFLHFYGREFPPRPPTLCKFQASYISLKILAFDTSLSQPQEFPIPSFWGAGKGGGAQGWVINIFWDHTLTNITLQEAAWPDCLGHWYCNPVIPVKALYPANSQVGSLSSQIQIFSHALYIASWSVTWSAPSSWDF